MKTLLAVLILASVGFSAPFCAVDKYGSNPMCFYYDMTSCQQAAARDGGFCTYNRETQQQPQPNPYPSAPQGNNGYQITGEAMQQSGAQIQQYSGQMTGMQFLGVMLISIMIVGGTVLTLMAING